MRRCTPAKARLLALLFVPGCVMAERATPPPRELVPTATEAAESSKPDAQAGTQALAEVLGDAAADAPLADPAKHEPLASGPAPIKRSNSVASPHAAEPGLPLPTALAQGDGIGMGVGRAGIAGEGGLGGASVTSPLAFSQERGRSTGKMAPRTKRALAFDRGAASLEQDQRHSAPLDVKDAVSAGINPLVDTQADRFSTFAIDVDTGSWTLAKRFLQGGSLPNTNAVRVEEWVNAFSYSYPNQGALHPFTIHMEGAPLAKQSLVLRVGIQGKEIEKREREPAHLTFLVDVSGSMSGRDRLPLAKAALGLLIDELNARDSVSLVTYAGSTRVVLPATRVDAAGRERIRHALDDLRNGGGTAMGDGMLLAYQEATKALGQKGSSRVIVLSDGDANIGRTGHDAILRSIKGYVSEGVTLSTIGFGTGNYRDHLMEQLADAGNGNYSYVGSLQDARKIFVEKLTGTLQVIAKDTKIQVEMNPAVVASYRLIGYENRDVADRDFRNDKVDAGEIGAGHTVTALYEVVLKDDEPRGDIATVRVRYKQPKGERGIETQAAFTASALRHDVDQMSADGRFAAGIGLVAEALRHSPHMDRLGIGIADALRLMESGASGPHAAERKEAVRLIAPLVEGAAVAHR